MEKVTCEVIQDLLVLYEDKACSAQSRKIVEEHINDCEDCRDIYEKMYEEIPLISVADGKGASILREAQHKIFLKQVVLMLLVMVILVGSYQFLTNWRFGISPDQIKVDKLYQLENGDIYYHLTPGRNFGRWSYSDMSRSGQEVMLSMGYTLGNELSNECLALEGMVAAEQKSIYLVKSPQKGMKDMEKKLIWKTGDKLAPASESIEKRVAVWREKGIVCDPVEVEQGRGVELE